MNYNPSFDTPLSPTDEVLYRLWKNRYAPRDSGADYDYRGAYAARETPSPPSGHWTDRFKKPGHPTFSVESQYAGAYPEKAGRWVGDRYVPAGYQQGTDSVPAMLTPHEAVLNVGAADILGRDRIRMLNARGQRRMYQQGTEDANMMNPLEYYQYGTSDVWTPIDDPNDPKLRDIPLNEPAPPPIPPTTAASDEPTGNPFLFGFRRNYEPELKDPAIRKQLYNLVHNEVGSGSPTRTVGFLEGLMNRANARGQTLAEAINDRDYYPKQSYRPSGYQPKDAALYDQHINTVLGGSNVSNYATGNASGDVGFNKGPTTAYLGGGERAGLEGPDIGWFQRLTGLKTPPPPSYYGGQVLPTPSGEPEPGTNLYATAPTTVAAETTSKPEGFDYKGFGKSVGKLGASLADEGEALVKQGGATGWALLNSGWGNPYIHQDPLAYIRAFMQFGGGG
jgi:hypothetical protein